MKKHRTNEPPDPGPAPRTDDLSLQERIERLETQVAEVVDLLETAGESFRALADEADSLTRRVKAVQGAVRQHEAALARLERSSQ